MSDFKQHFVRDKRICGGALVFKGTRVSLRTILASLAEGDSAEKLLSEFPSLSHEHIRAAIAFAAASAERALRASESSEAAGNVPITDEQRAELDRRLDDLDDNPDDGMSLDELKRWVRRDRSK